MATVRPDMVLSESTVHAPIGAPLDIIDIGAWLLALPDAEYQRCAPPDHWAAGATTTDDGRPMSINVEMIGTGLVVQHYVGETVGPHHCRMVSTSDVLMPNGRTYVQVVWDLSCRLADGGQVEYTNAVTSHPTDEFLAFIKEHGQTFEEAAAARQAASADHNRRETPLFAASIGRAALRAA